MITIGCKGNFVTVDTNPKFFQHIVQSLDHHLAVVDTDGKICFVNEAWLQFSRIHNEYSHQWVGYSYWEVSENDPVVVSSLKKLLAGEIDRFSYEYHFHSEQQQRWYLMTATPLLFDQKRYALITHCDITPQKNTEAQIRELTLTDSLTGLPNHRHFTQFFEQEWRRGKRYNQPLSLLLLDIDHFKRYNDNYGHKQGDVCLQQIGKLLRGFAQRPGDLMARYGGEEFALVLANTTSKDAQRIAADIVAAVSMLKLYGNNGFATDSITISIGVATQIPKEHSNKDLLFQASDKALYQAKSEGRNRFCVATDFA